VRTICRRSAVGWSGADRRLSALRWPSSTASKTRAAGSHPPIASRMESSHACSIQTSFGDDGLHLRVDSKAIGVDLVLIDELLRFQLRDSFQAAYCLWCSHTKVGNGLARMSIQDAKCVNGMLFHSLYSDKWGRSVQYEVQPASLEARCHA
jgi:hypothetical protein